MGWCTLIFPPHVNNIFLFILLSDCQLCLIKKDVHFLSVNILLINPYDITMQNY